MKNYRTFEVNDRGCRIKGIINLRLDDEDNTIFQKLKKIGLNINKTRNKLVWWDDDYIEIINKRSEKTIAIMEVCY